MRWTIKPKPEKNAIDTLSKELKVDRLVAQLLLQRGITNYAEAKKFFRPELSDLHDPFLMKEMDVAVERIEKAIANNENILVFGDYDVDGTTSVALVSSYLMGHYPNIATYIPDRYGEGYGISYQGIDFAEDNDFSLIIALDCGVKAIDKVSYAKEKNIDFIICDHHRPGEFLPDAVAVLDPMAASSVAVPPAIVTRRSTTGSTRSSSCDATNTAPPAAAASVMSASTMSRPA